VGPRVSGGADKEGLAASSHEPGPAPPAQLVQLATPSLRGVLRIVLIVVGCAIALYLVWRIRTVVQLAAISVFLTLVIFPTVDALERRSGVHRGTIILGVYLLLLISVVVIGYVVVPSTVKEISELSRNAPRYAQELRSNSTFRHYDDHYHISAKLVQDARRLPQTLAHLAGPLRTVTVSAVGFFGQLITVLALTFLLTLHGREYTNAALSFTGAREERYRQLIIKINRAVAGYMLGNVLISAMVTVFTWVVLSILGVPYAISLGFVMGFFDLIPLVGATLGSIVAALATTTVSFPIATIIWIVAIFLWQRFENYAIQPLIYGRVLHVNPIVTILAVLAGASLLGLLGALIAIPTAAAIQIVLSDWWSNRRARTEIAEDGATTAQSGVEPAGA
jgi:predicted PurR-regulated permease PerM